MINIITSFYYIDKNDKQSMDRNEELFSALHLLTFQTPIIYRQFYK
jgi:hypothetical protein